LRFETRLGGHLGDQDLTHTPVFTDSHGRDGVAGELLLADIDLGSDAAAMTCGSLGPVWAMDAAGKRIDTMKAIPARAVSDMYWLAPSVAVARGGRQSEPASASGRMPACILTD
jgi:hypothetical protein